eukprot:CAMPEP_0177327206 /NCGR_PEP_ID=MMETSP0368-20130122/18767_1 /TAXON_ID=447022 ORGANISM="Scrippsiella hangoei-like, Strain SHHI-4" /NCGR_SAMPLE_ID=MMETSP0368 /ASSEMBLY_ACC=CAM_ASM_000363 /LENGTH=274 /DNA_ID=CAMNT_0018787253 /DNA_START=83 /DNA_END=904 /DNA_ORIENTATION=-
MFGVGSSRCQALPPVLLPQWPPLVHDAGARGARGERVWFGQPTRIDPVLLGEAHLLQAPMVVVRLRIVVAGEDEGCLEVDESAPHAGLPGAVAPDAWLKSNHGIRLRQRALQRHLVIQASQVSHLDLTAAHGHDAWSENLAGHVGAVVAEGGADEQQRHAPHAVQLAQRSQQLGEDVAGLLDRAPLLSGGGPDDVQRQAAPSPRCRGREAEPQQGAQRGEGPRVPVALALSQILPLLCQRQRRPLCRQGERHRRPSFAGAGAGAGDTGWGGALE